MKPRHRQNCTQWAQQRERELDIQSSVCMWCVCVSLCVSLCVCVCLLSKHTKQVHSQTQMRPFRCVRLPAARVALHFIYRSSSVAAGTKPKYKRGHVIFDRHSAASVDTVTPCHSIMACCTRHPSWHEFFMLYVTHAPTYTQTHTYTHTLSGKSEGCEASHRQASHLCLGCTLWKHYETVFKENITGQILAILGQIFLTFLDCYQSPTKNTFHTFPWKYEIIRKFEDNL